MSHDPALDPLFQPITLRGLTLPNRLAMAPMTRSASPGNTPDAAVIDYYRKRVAGGTGLIVTEGVGVDQAASLGEGSGAPTHIPLLHGERALAGWRAVVAAVHAEGGCIFPQLWHQGAFRVEGTGPQPAAPSLRPSGLWGPDDGYSTVTPDYIARVIAPTRPMREEEIADAVAGFARSAANAKAVGFDGIAIHGASGYLIDSFFWPQTNRRTDRYGGDMAARATFGVEVVRAIRAAIGPDMPIMFRFGQWKQQDFNARIAETPDELGVLMRALAEAGVDLIDASTIYFSAPAFDGSPLSLAGWARKLSGRPTVAVGGIGLSEGLFSSFRTGGAAVERNFHDAAARIAAGEFDMIALGRALIADPEWPNRVRRGEPTNAYVRDMLARLD
ncbi:12-oxophytodienoate reductase [Sphingomonas solaris]|uniref:12-oxophytodienoate reductase n=1 Tax=Alterirhizorhabdus solaris TaxID=2529389 RepID=A0A558RCS6_9SPHN|nr:12-oxophytodienoate reductase [Sphingomonas solaris]TVV77130.1 12-oxophytodienoate reductase [Sphingomonas solaris]